MIKELLRYLKKQLINYRYSHLTKKDLKKLSDIKKDFPKVYSTTETLNLIINEHISIARFGDGEFNMCIGKTHKNFWQKPDEVLIDRLVKILGTSEKGFLACIPSNDYDGINKRKSIGNLTFYDYYWLRLFNKIKPLFKNSVYGNTSVSRSPVFYENKINDIKAIWNDRKIVFVYGKNGRFEEDSKLFDNARKIDTIFVKPINAFDEYDDILKKCLSFPKDILFLISAGPTATVLAYDLFKNGYQALDIGHMPNSFDEYNGEIKSPECLPIIKN